MPEEQYIYDGFVFDEETGTFIPPVPYPDDGQEYYWHTESESWQLIVEE